jgi:hypothetical protein
MNSINALAAIALKASRSSSSNESSFINFQESNMRLLLEEKNDNSSNNDSKQWHFIAKIINIIEQNNFVWKSWLSDFIRITIGFSALLDEEINLLFVIVENYVTNSVNSNQFMTNFEINNVKNNVCKCYLLKSYLTKGLLPIVNLFNCTRGLISKKMLLEVYDEINSIVQLDPTFDAGGDSNAKILNFIVIISP